MNADAYQLLCRDCRTVQRETLLKILRLAANSAYGRKFGFSRISSIDEFKQQVPVASWADLAPYAQKAANGDPNQLFAGIPKLFIITSGTSGRAKQLPESARGLEMKRLISKLRVEMITSFCPGQNSGMLLPLVNSAKYGSTPAGIPFGSASGITLMTAPEALKRCCAYPLAVMNIANAEAMDYTVMRFALTTDVRLVTVNNAGRFTTIIDSTAANADLLLRDIRNGTITDSIALSDRERDALRPFLKPKPQLADKLTTAAAQANGLLPAIYWKNLQTVNCWLGGSIGRYTDILRQKLPEETIFHELGYGATEGKFTIPLQPETISAPLAHFAYFFEFRQPDGNGPFLTADEVEDGGRYEIFITSYSGLYRYTIRDIIEVDGFTGTVPNIKFLHKSGDIADICGEKLTVPNLIAAIKKAEQITGLRTVHWCVLPDNDTKRYIFCIEFEPQNDTPEAADTLAAAVERELFGDGIMPYPVFRRQKLLLPVAVQRMKPGWLEAISAGQARNQLKPPVIVSRIPYPKYICKE
jgi:hypothetical protein